MADNKLNNGTLVSQTQQVWEEMLFHYKDEADKLMLFIRSRERRNAKTSSELDEAKLRLIQLEVVMRKHFDFAYQTPGLVDAYMRNKQFLPVTRSDRIQGMLYTNYGDVPVIDTSTRMGFFNKSFLNTLGSLQHDWRQFSDNVNRFYDRNKGDIRQLCEAGGDYMAGSAISNTLSSVMQKSPLPRQVHSELMGQFGDQGGKTMSPGKIACDRLLGSKSKPFKFP